MFTTEDQELGVRGFFESLVPDSCVYSNVIDMWAKFLNHEEQFKDQGSPFRVYCDTSTMVQICLHIYYF